MVYIPIAEAKGFTPLVITMSAAFLMVSRSKRKSDFAIASKFSVSRRPFSILLTKNTGLRVYLSLNSVLAGAAEAVRDGCGGRIRTYDHRLMRPVSYRCSTPHYFYPKCLFA